MTGLSASCLESTMKNLCGQGGITFIKKAERYICSGGFLRAMNTNYDERAFD